MNNAQAIVAHQAKHTISPKREIVLREMLSLGKNGINDCCPIFAYYSGLDLNQSTQHKDVCYRVYSATPP